MLASELTDEQKEALEHLTAADPWGVDEDPPATTALPLSEKDARIFELEKKVNALAELMDTTKTGDTGGEPMAGKAFRERAHRPYGSYFECVHSTIAEVHKKRAKHVVTPECRAEVRDTYARRFADIRKDAELVEACGGGHKREKADVEFLPDPDDDDDRSNNAARGEAVAGGDIGKFCADVKPGLGLVFRCLVAQGGARARVRQGCRVPADRAGRGHLAGRLRWRSRARRTRSPCARTRPGAAARSSSA